MMAQFKKQNKIKPGNTGREAGLQEKTVSSILNLQGLPGGSVS